MLRPKLSISPRVILEFLQVTLTKKVRSVLAII